MKEVKAAQSTFKKQRDMIRMESEVRPFVGSINSVVWYKGTSNILVLFDMDQDYRLYQAFFIEVSLQGNFLCERFHCGLNI